MCKKNFKKRENEILEPTNNSIFIAIAFLCFIASCGNNKDNRAAEEIADVTVSGDTVIIAENSHVWERIIVQQAQLQDYSAEFRTVGTVRPVSGKLAEITTPFAVRIVKSHVKLGQKVSAGSPIFELSSAEYYEAVKSYFAAQSANEVAQRNFSRQKELAANGVASQKDLEQAQSETTIAQHEFEQAKACLQIFNIDIAHIGATTVVTHALPVHTPISGEVVKYNITIGGYVKEDAEPLAVVADLSKVWVAAIVKERYFGAIKQGDRVEIYSNANPDKVISGTIYYIGKMLDEETRSLEVIVECDNAGDELKLGMFCETHFLSTPVKAVVLPTSAIMQAEDHDCVFVQTEKGKFVRRSVVTSECIHKDEIHIVSGISDGEKVVVKGGMHLK